MLPVETARVRGRAATRLRMLVGIGFTPPRLFLVPATSFAEVARAIYFLPLPRLPQRFQAALRTPLWDLRFDVFR